jgi:hypothetical protein
MPRTTIPALISILLCQGSVLGLLVISAITINMSVGSGSMKAGSKQILRLDQELSRLVSTVFDYRIRSNVMFSKLADFERNDYYRKKFIETDTSAKSRMYSRVDPLISGLSSIKNL